MVCAAVGAELRGEVNGSMGSSCVVIGTMRGLLSSSTLLSLRTSGGGSCWSFLSSGLILIAFRGEATGMLSSSCLPPENGFVSAVWSGGAKFRSRVSMPLVSHFRLLSFSRRRFRISRRAATPDTRRRSAPMPDAIPAMVLVGSVIVELVDGTGDGVEV